MSEERFRFEKECTENFFTEKGVFYNNERPMSANEIIALLNSLYDENGQLKQKVDFYKYFQKDARELEKENEKLRKQIQNYEKLIVNSYVGEEERLDGWVGQYVIWEDELQECKNKNEMIE